MNSMNPEQDHTRLDSCLKESMSNICCDAILRFLGNSENCSLVVLSDFDEVTSLLQLSVNGVKSGKTDAGVPFVFLGCRCLADDNPPILTKEFPIWNLTYLGGE
jgi:hypothetical protein